jgi:hypothetical protein
VLLGEPIDDIGAGQGFAFGLGERFALLKS